MVYFWCYIGGAVSLPILLAKWVGCQCSFSLWWMVFNPTSADRLVYWSRTQVILKRESTVWPNCNIISCEFGKTLFKCYFDTRATGTSGRTLAQHTKVEGSSLATAVGTGREKTAGGGGGGMVNTSVSATLVVNRWLTVPPGKPYWRGRLHTVDLLELNKFRPAVFDIANLALVLKFCNLNFPF